MAHDLPGVPSGAARVPSESGDDLVVREEPLLIEVAGERVLTMRTPGDDADLALGFLLSEGILASLEQVARVEVAPRAEAEGGSVDGVRVHVLPGAELGPVARERLTRAHAIRPSCGLCGLVSAEGLTRHLRPLTPGAPRVTVARLGALAERMRAEQPLFRATGGCHAAAVFDLQGEEVWSVREDVGRHNALDKVLGACAQAGRDLSRAGVLLSGRGGFELILKALRMGIPVVASVSAPTSLSVELAEEHGQTLVGFLRPRADGAYEGRVYADDARISGD